MKQISELLYQVPRPPEDSIPTGISTIEIERFEERAGTTFPTELRNWLSLTNGPCIGPGGFYGIHPLRSDLDIESCVSRFPDWRERKWIPIAGDGCGNYYIIPTQNEFGVGSPVVFVDVRQATTSPTYLVASDLEHFIVGTLQKELGVEGWPFSRSHVISFDPQITRYRGVPFPWDEVSL